MGFIPYTYPDGQPAPWEYKEAGALGAIQPGQALNLSSGKLAKCTGDNRPEYIGMYRGTVASGDIIPCIKVDEETVFETVNSVANTSAVAGSQLTIDSTGTKITATAGTAVEVVDALDTAAGGRMLVRFPRIPKTTTAAGGGG
nr:MAG TPA: hypothetical protein [Caudoviricetes sp.]